MQQKIIEYRGEKNHRKGLTGMSKKGWQAGNTVTSVPRTSILRFIMLGGIGALVFRPKTRFLVTFCKP